MSAYEIMLIRPFFCNILTAFDSVLSTRGAARADSLLDLPFCDRYDSIPLYISNAIL